MSVDQTTPAASTVRDADPQPSVADQLRAFAAFIDANAALVGEHYLHISAVTPVGDADDPKATIAAFARAGLRAAATVTKDITDLHGGIYITFGHKVKLNVFASRDQVCERVVVGTEQVTRQVPDPDALAAVPTVEVTETVEQVEWICRPMLAAEQQPVADLGDVAAGRVTVPDVDTTVGLVESTLLTDGGTS